MLGRHQLSFALVIGILLPMTGCEDTPSNPEVGGLALQARAGTPDGPHELSPPVFGIAAAPNGNILVAETVFPGIQPGAGTSTTIIKEIHKGGMREVAEVATPEGSPVNGLAAVGQGNLFVTSGGLDLAVAAGVWRVSRGGARLVGDIEAFETARDPDALEGPQWKHPSCEGAPFSAGPQSNPYHLTAVSGGTVLVGDAAGNTVLSVTASGEVDWVAVVTPPTETGGSSSDPADWMVLFPLDAATDCYVQPVPTSVAIGPDGDYFVGELTGVTPADIGLGGGATTGLSRVWRIEAGARHVVCPSADCQMVLSGFTSIIDLAFGPDGMLYVVEYDEQGWFTAVGGAVSSGNIHACDVESVSCATAADGLALPSAIAFDKRGDLWVLENNLGIPGVGDGVPTVRRLDLP